MKYKAEILKIFYALCMLCALLVAADCLRPFRLTNEAYYICVAICFLGLGCLFLDKLKS